MKLAFILLPLFALAASAFARSYVVRPDGAGQFPTIQAAINAVSNGDTIELTNGTFTSLGNRDIDYLGKAIVIRSQSGNADSCVIDCQQRGRGFCFYSGERPSSVLEGVTVRDGEANEGGGIWCHYNSSPTFNTCTIAGNSTIGFHTNGGGVYCYHSSPTFMNCTFDNNRANHAGGGAYFIDSSPSLINCTFNGNVSADYGGAIHFEHSPSAICASCTLRNSVAGLEGGALACSHSSPIFTNCVLHGNSALWYGGGVACFDSSSPSFANCTVSGDTAQEEGGGGVSCRNSSSPTFTDCAINGNCAYPHGGGIFCEQSSLNLTGCTISGNTARSSGGGIWCRQSVLNLANCTISGNTADFDGGGVWCYESVANLANCTISGNTADYDGGGVWCYDCPLTLTNCTLSGNSADGRGGGAYCDYSYPTFSSTIIAFSQGVGIYLVYFGILNYCDIFGNSGGPVGGSAPAGFGQPQMTNANGDSCDIYHNIFLDPMFGDTAEGDYHLLAGSPCVDAGDPALPFDPDSTIADIGAFYYHQLAAEPLAVLLPRAYALHPNWPNPFNSSTMIRYDVPQAGKVSLTVFNLLGQRVATLFDGRQLSGSYTISWDAANLPSGLYLCRMDAAGFVQTRKLVLVK